MKKSFLLLLLIMGSLIVSGCQSARSLTAWRPQKLIDKWKSDEPIPVIPNKDATLANHQPTTESIKEAITEFEQGESHLNLGHLSRAKKHFNEVVKLQPNHAAAHHRLAYIADQQRDYATAEIHYLTALRLDPRNADIACDLGYSYFLQDRHEPSERYLNKALELDPRHAAAVMNLAALKGQQNDYEGALALLRKVGDEQQAQAQLAKLFPDGPPAKTALAGHQQKGSDPSLILSNLPQNQDLNESTLKIKDMMEQAKRDRETSPMAASMQQGNPFALKNQSFQEVPPENINDIFSQIDAEGKRRPSQVMLLDSVVDNRPIPPHGQDPFAQSHPPQGFSNQQSGSQAAHLNPLAGQSTAPLPFGQQAPTRQPLSSQRFDPRTPPGASLASHQSQPPSMNLAHEQRTVGPDPRPSMIAHQVPPAETSQVPLASFDRAMDQAAALGMNLGPGELFPSVPTARSHYRPAEAPGNRGRVNGSPGEDHIPARTIHHQQQLPQTMPPDDRYQRPNLGTMEKRST